MPIPQVPPELIRTRWEYSIGRYEAHPSGPAGSKTERIGMGPSMMDTGIQ